MCLLLLVGQWGGLKNSEKGLDSRFGQGSGFTLARRARQDANIRRRFAVEAAREPDR